MEELWLIDRQRLRDLLSENPVRPYPELAAEVGRSLGWVKKWAPHLKQNLNNDHLLRRRTSPRQYTCPSRSAQVIEKILDIRDHPPDHLRRTPGPQAILYYLHQDPALQTSAVRLPRSSRVVWQVLDHYQRIRRKSKTPSKPLAPVEPMQHWQFDFKDATTAQDPETFKLRHQVETLNIVDSGTSIVIDNHVRSDFKAETAIFALASTFLQRGLPKTVTFDRDPRFVGAQQSRDFPSALVRFLTCLGIQPIVCPPHRPDKNPYVERFHRSLEEEALQIERPTTVAETDQCLVRYRHHYNYERPNQAHSCRNRPPYVAFPHLPSLPYPPQQVSPDVWLNTINGRLYKRRVSQIGTVQVAHNRYYIQKQLHGQFVTLKVQAQEHNFEVWFHGKSIKTIPIKGLLTEALPFQDYLRLICKEAATEDRLQLRKSKQLRSTIWSKHFGTRG